jgi:uncharacterized membrane protein
MNRYEWLLFLHVLAAVMLVAGVVFFAALLIAGRRASGRDEFLPLLRLSGPGFLLWNVGGLAVLVFGVWLAIDLDQYDVTDGWIIGAIVLWVLASAAGGRAGAAYREAVTAPEAEAGAKLAAAVQSGQALVLHGAMAVTVLALLVVMIYKPGA